MTDTLTQFQWPVAEDGYQWGQHAKHGPEQWFLRWPGVPRTKFKAFLYAPMQQSGLFLKFAKLKPQKASIQAFANEYGLLARGDLLKAPGESFESWTFAVRQFSHAVSLWKMADAGDVRGLARFIRWKGSEGINYDSGKLGLGARWIVSRLEPELLASFVPGDLIHPAWCQIQYILNQHLSGNVSPRLLWNTSRSRLSLHYVPSDLLSALWLQLARAVDGERVFRQCAECRNYYEVESPDGARSDKKYCNSACRARAWRKAKETT